MHDAVNVSGLTIAAIAHNFSLADVNFGQGKGDRGTIPGRQGDHGVGLSEQSSVSAQKAGHVCLK